jgi:hypothetical protein
MKLQSIPSQVLAFAFAAGISVVPCQASPADDAAHAARMATQANLSFEQAAGPETQYVTALKYNQNPVDYANLRERIAAAIEALNP